MFGKYDNLSGIVPPATGMASRWGGGEGIIPAATYVMEHVN
jgi:hypothetical protein